MAEKRDSIRIWPTVRAYLALNQARKMRKREFSISVLAACFGILISVFLLVYGLFFRNEPTPIWFFVSDSVLFAMALFRFLRWLIWKT